MDPAVFLTNPESGAVRAFMQVARPSIRRWVENHYECYRRLFPAPDDTDFPGAHRVEVGAMLRHHVLGEYKTVVNHGKVDVSMMAYHRTGTPQTGKYPILKPVLRPDGSVRVASNFDSWLYSGERFGVLDHPSQDRYIQSLDTDLDEGGQSNYFLLPSLSKMIVDNIRLGFATPDDVVNFMATTLYTYYDKQEKAKANSIAAPNIFEVDDTGADPEYRFFYHLDSVIRKNPRLLAMFKFSGITKDPPFDVRAATRRLSQTFEGDLYDFKDLEFKDFKEAMKNYLKPVLFSLKAPYPIGQIVSVMDGDFTIMVPHKTEDKMVRLDKRDSRYDSIRDGTWRVLRSGRKKKKVTVGLVSEVDPDAKIDSVSETLLLIPTGEDDLRAKSDVRSNNALPLFEAVVEAFCYLDTVNSLALSKVDHSRFTKNHFRDFDKTQFDGEWNTTKKAVFFGDWFIDARTDQMVAFYANMWDKKPNMRKSLENLFRDDNFAMAEISWYTDIIARHINPTLVPKMEQRGLPTQAIAAPQTLPGVDAVFQFATPEKVDLKLESPLLRDAYLAYTREFNDWFSQLLIGANRGYLYAEPFGPAGPGGDGKKAKKKIKAARDSMAGATREAWAMARTSILSLRNIGVPDKDILRVLRREVSNRHREFGTSRPALPPGGARSVEDFLTFVADLYDSDAIMLAAVARAADELRIDFTSDIEQVEDMFLTDIRRHMKMKALGSQRFPALAVAVEILRG